MPTNVILVGHCVKSRQSIDKQLFSYFSADPIKIQKVPDSQLQTLINQQGHFPEETASLTIISISLMK